MRHYKPRPPHGSTNVEFRDRTTGRLIASYTNARSVFHAKDCLRKLMVREQKAKAKFLAQQEGARQRIADLLQQCLAATPAPLTPEQRRAASRLRQLSKQQIPWDDVLLELKIFGRNSPIKHNTY